MKEADLFRQMPRRPCAGPPCPARFAVQSYLVGELLAAGYGHALFFVDLSFAVGG